jgi:transglutaminase-like putative cysteine protease
MAEARYRIEHETRYQHANRVASSKHVACLKPRDDVRQAVLDHALQVSPTPAEETTLVDYFGNTLHQFSLLTPYEELVVMSRCLVEVLPRLDVILTNESPAWEQVRDALARDAWARDAQEFSFASPLVDIGPAAAAFAAPSLGRGRSVLDVALDLMHRIHADFTFDAGATTVATPVEDVFEARHGVCQDFAHVLVACLRSVGLAARYVSGYLLTEPPKGHARLIGADASHAWASVWCPRHGWVDLDPTNDVVPDLRHVTIGWGRDYGDVSPLRGVILGGGEQTLHVGVSVIPEVEYEPDLPPPSIPFGAFRERP